MSDFDALARRAQETLQAEQAKQAAENDRRRLQSRLHDAFVALSEALRILTEEITADYPIDTSQYRHPNPAEYIPAIRETLIGLGDVFREAGRIPDFAVFRPTDVLAGRFQSELEKLNGKVTLEYAWKLLEVAWDERRASEKREQIDGLLTRTMMEDGLRQVRIWIQLLAGRVLESDPADWSAKTQQPAPASSPPAQEPAEPPQQSEDQLPALSRRQYLILQTMLKLKATDPERRKTTSQIALAAEGPDANPESFKIPMAALVRRRLVETKGGRGGGCWLTSAGKSLAEELRKR